jgi:hypothetical protein
VQRPNKTGSRRVRERFAATGAATEESKLLGVYKIASGPSVSAPDRIVVQLVGVAIEQITDADAVRITRSAGEVSIVLFRRGQALGGRARKASTKRVDGAAGAGQ